MWDDPGKVGRKEPCVDEPWGLVRLAHEEGKGRGLAVDHPLGNAGF